MAVSNFKDLYEHFGHDVRVVVYSKDDVLKNAHNVSIECVTCYEVLVSYDNEEVEDERSIFN